MGLGPYSGQENITLGYFGPSKLWPGSGHSKTMARGLNFASWVYKHIADIMAKYLHDLPKIHIVNKTRPPIKPAPPIVPAPQRKLFTKTRGD